VVVRQFRNVAARCVSYVSLSLKLQSWRRRDTSTLRTKTIKQIKPALTLHVPYKSEIKQNIYQQSNESV
jgi:hypothetical protein